MNYFDNVPSGINLLLLSKSDYNSSALFCSIFVSNLCEDKLTWRYMIKSNYPELYKMLIETNNLDVHKLDRLYYVYKDNIYGAAELINTNIYSFETPYIIYDMLDKSLDLLVNVSINDEVVCDLICYNNYPGIYSRLKDIIDKNNLEYKYISKSGWFQEPFKIIQWKTILYSLIYSSELLNLQVNEYLINGKLSDYPTLNKLIGSVIDPRNPNPYSSYNFMFLFLYVREAEVDINGEKAFEFLFGELGYISHRLGYDIDWLIDKTNDKNIDIIYDDMIERGVEIPTENISKREKVKSLYFLTLM